MGVDEELRREVESQDSHDAPDVAEIEEVDYGER